MVWKLTRKILLLMVLIFGTILLILWIPINQPNHYLLASIDKEKRLAETESPKIVIIGGSNTVFNVNSQIIQKSTGFSVINMGLHAGLGLKYSLNEIENYIQSNDVVIIMPEYDQFFSNLFFGGRIVTRLVSLRHDAVKYIKHYRQWLGLIKSAGLEVRSKLVALLGYQSDDETYSRDAFNDYGDIRTDLIGFESNPELAKTDYEIRSMDELSTAAISELNKFNDRIMQIGARVYLAFSAVPREKYGSCSSQITGLYDYLQTHLDFPILFEPEETLFSLNDFFDTLYHLNDNGRQRYTEILVNYLLNSL